MASSKGSPGPHDRRNPRTQCIKLTRLRKRCKRDAIGTTKLCKAHKALAELEAAGTPNEDRAGNLGGSVYPEPEPADLVKAGIHTSVVKQSKQRMSAFVITEQSRQALDRLGARYDPQLDPKRVLLDNVEAAWRQRQIWEQMLAAIPDDDWQFLGQTPIPGVPQSAKGARIEVIQKFLSEATKVSMRSSKLAIDAGIEERLVRLAEEQSALIADTVRAGIIAGIAALARLGMISEADQAAATDAAIGSAATHLRQLASGEGGPASGTQRSTPEIYEGIAHEVKAS